MKPIYLAIFLSISYSIGVQANTNLTDFTAQLNAVAQSAFIEIDKQMAIKINLSGKQRMLTQKMSKEVLLISLDIDADKNKKNLEASAALFEKTLAGLEKGEESLDLTKTDDKEILQQLAKVKTLWSDFKPNIESTLSGETTEEIVKSIASSNLPLLSAMNKAVGMYAVNSGSELDELATVINLSGKQRMLTQKMTKELLLIASKINQTENQNHLKNTIQLFDKTLKGLLNGDKELELPATKNKAIIQQLTTVKKLWGDLKPLIEKADTSSASLQEVAKLNLPLLSEMNKVVKMYEAQSE